MTDQPAPLPHGPEVRLRPDLDPHFIVTIIGAAGDHDRPLLRRMLAPLHPAEVAAVLAQVPRETVRTVVTLLKGDFPVEVLAELDDDAREIVLEVLPAELVGRSLEDLDTDDAVAVLEDLDDAEREAILAAAPDDVRFAVEQGLAFDEETAGRLMQREFVAAPQFWTVGQAIDHMRAAGDDLPDLFYELYLVDPAFRPVGATPVSTLLRSRREVTLTELARPPSVLVRPEMDQEEVALAFQKYSLISAPVVDASGRLTGMITVDDIVHVIQQENKEDMLALAGVSEAQAADTIWTSVKARAPWLGVNLGTALVASFFISLFEPTIEQVVALAILMPIVASLGGNAGTQTLAVAVRALAARELTPANALRAVGREVATGACNGVLVAALLALVAGAWFQNPLISLTIALAVVLNVTIAGLAGILVPLGLKRAGADPAVSSSVFVTFVTDVVGFGVFLALGTLILL
jgi:magnesium transporter